MEKKYSQIVAKAWTDKNFKDRLKNHPKEVLSEFGIAVESHVELRVVENTETVQYFVLPLQPIDAAAATDPIIICGGGA